MMVSSSEMETLELSSRLNLFLFCSFLFLFNEMMKFGRSQKVQVDVHVRLCV